MTEMAIFPSTKDDDEDVQDPMVDPLNPKAICFKDITSAAYKIKSGIVRTPCETPFLTAKQIIRSVRHGNIFKKRVFAVHGQVSTVAEEIALFYTYFNQMKLSFKERGARYALMMLSDAKKKKGIVAASSGNHAQAVSYHGLQLGIPVIVVMPVIAPIMKVHRCQKLKAKVVVQGNDVDESKKVGLKIAKANNMTYINSYDHPHVLAGQGTIALEILEQVPDVDAIVIPCGGGGLIAGVGLAVKTMKPEVSIIGAESERCAAFSKSMKAGRPVYVPLESTLADGLGVPLIGHNAFETAKNYVDKMAVVKEASIAMAILRCAETEKCVVEGAGAIPVAAAIEGQLAQLKGKKVVLILSGGNIDTTILSRCLERGLAADGRLIKVTVCVTDRPGGMAELIKLIASIRVNIKDVTQERAWVAHDVFSVDVTIVCETRNGEHSKELHDLLKQHYKKVVMEDGKPCLDKSECN